VVTGATAGAAAAGAAVSSGCLLHAASAATTMDKARSVFRYFIKVSSESFQMGLDALPHHRGSSYITHKLATKE
jgi:hypothetical protein